MWWIGPIAAGIAVYRLFSAGATALAWIAVVILVAGIWAAGIAANFRGQEHAIPNGAAMVSMLAALGGIIMLVVSFFV